MHFYCSTVATDTVGDCLDRRWSVRTVRSLLHSRVRLLASGGLHGAADHCVLASDCMILALTVGPFDCLPLSALYQRYADCSSTVATIAAVSNCAVATMARWRLRTDGALWMAARL